MTRAKPADTVVDFLESVDILKRREALEAIRDAQHVLTELRKDMQWIALVEAMSIQTLIQPIAIGPGNPVLAEITRTLHEISRLLPDTRQLNLSE